MMSGVWTKITFFKARSRGCNSLSALHMRTDGNNSKTFPMDSFGTPTVSKKVRTGLSSVSKSRKKM